ncbi:MULTISPECIES: acyl carrier protein [unclassified Pseudofrankia]|uniref:acyl carrier protein n=1 Tax=unclassified Pseudofrankia TaxID=2994372 RepID=UPI000E2A15F6|nr:acyl carrier protein [Pseudofrankia sp. BMG5.37]MDT3438110.1 acyl carrier protein [Pseudofrankia sp. BMG5.37]
MPADIEAAARENLAAVLTFDVAPADLASDVDLTGTYGLTSLNKVLFLTSLCRDTGVDIARLTEDDLAGMHTLRDCVDILSPHLPAGT